MVNDHNYSARLCVSKKVKKYLNYDVRIKFLEDHKEREGTKITENELVSYLIRARLEIFELENGESK